MTIAFWVRVSQVVRVEFDEENINDFKEKYGDDWHDELENAAERSVKSDINNGITDGWYFEVEETDDWDFEIEEVKE